MQRRMRSFSSCQATDMDWLFWFSLLLTYLPVTGQMPKNNCLPQPEKVIWRKIGQSVDLPCNLRPSCSGPSEWFVFKQHSHIRLEGKENRHMRIGTHLRINSLHPNDSGIYYCAATSHEVSAPRQRVKLVTTLVVREKIKVTARYILLWVAFSLLAIYSLALVTLIIKKYGCNLRVCRKEHKNDMNNSTKKKQFHDVLQELYKRKNLERSKRTASSGRPKAEAASASSSADDIYQNV